MYRKGQTVTIHYVFRPIQPNDYAEGAARLDGDVLEAAFANGDAIPFRCGPHYRGQSPKAAAISALFYEDPSMRTSLGVVPPWRDPR